MKNKSYIEDSLNSILEKLSLKEKHSLVDKLSGWVTEARWSKIKNISQQRTRYATAILEDIRQPHNISAALRSAECFGIQNMHIIEQEYKYDVNPTVSKGAVDWLSVYRYKIKENNNTKVCFDSLKSQGYKIYATTPHTDDKLIYDLPLDNKVALVFGTESSGISDYAIKNADGFVKIPMYGFTESFNISVSVAICLYDISRRLREGDYNWRLSEEEILDLQIKWLDRTTGKLDKIL